MNVTWLMAHERLILVTLGILVLLYLGHIGINRHYDAAHDQSVVASTVLKQQQDADKVLQQKYDLLAVQTAEMQKQYQQENAELALKAADAYKAAAAQAAKDAQLTNQQLAQRLNELTNQKGIQSTDNGVGLTHDQTVQVAQDLETIPALKQQVAFDKTVENNDDIMISGLTKQVDSCNNLNDNLSKQIVDEKASHVADVKQLKAKNWKDKTKWGVVGAIAGFIAKIFI